MIKKVLLLFFCMILFSSLVSAGMGIKWSQESAMVNEGEKTCMTYGVYNPFSGDSYVTITLSDSLKQVLTLQDADTKMIPAGTPSANAIPIQFCFKVPSDVYKRDYQISGKFIDKLDCDPNINPQKVYEGQVIVKSVPPPTQLSGSGGSTTEMAVSAPLRIRIECNSYGWNYTLVYVVVVFISALVIAMVLFRRYRKPKEQRIKEKMAKLRAEMRKK